MCWIDVWLKYDDKQYNNRNVTGTIETWLKTKGWGFLFVCVEADFHLYIECSVLGNIRSLMVPRASMRQCCHRKWKSFPLLFPKHCVFTWKQCEDDAPSCSYRLNAIASVPGQWTLMCEGTLIIASVLDKYNKCDSTENWRSRSTLFWVTNPAQMMALMLLRCCCSLVPRYLYLK